MDASAGRKWIFITLLGLIAVTTQVLAIHLDRSGWVHHDAIYGTGSGPLSSREQSAPHERALNSLERWELVAGFISIISLGALLFFVLRGDFIGLKAVGILTAGILSFLGQMSLGLSIMDVTVEEQRHHASEMHVLSTITLACPIVAGILGLTSKRAWIKILGSLLIAGEIIIVVWLLTASP